MFATNPLLAQATQPAQSRGKTAAQTVSKMDPNAKWSCDKTEVKLAPVWRGQKSLNFDFEIKNTGTSDLRIRAKGG